MSYKVKKSDEEWKELLSKEEYRVLREKGTDLAFTGKYDQTTEHGSYLCKGCGEKLFASDAKYDAGCGWPSFFQPDNKDNIEYQKDTSLGRERTEILCSSCGGHLGHVFDDGPRPTHQRYCVNSTSIKFNPSK